MGLVSLNFQERDKYMWLNEGFFLDNGGCGYVLKPLPLRRTPQSLVPQSSSLSKLLSSSPSSSSIPTDRKNISNLCVRILSGNFTKIIGRYARRFCPANYAWIPNRR